MQRHHRRLEREHAREQQCSDPQQALIFGRDFCNAQAHIGHVERARKRIEQAECNKEQRRADKVHHHILHARLQPRGPLPVQHQAIGRDQQHLEKHEEVEQIASQEGTVEAHQLELEEGVEMPALAINPGDHRVQQRDQRKGRGQHQHDRRQAVHHQHDPERRGPATHRIGADNPAIGLHKQCQGAHKHRRAGSKAHANRPARMAPHQQQRERSSQRRNRDRQDREVIGKGHSPLPSASAVGTASPST